MSRTGSTRRRATRKPIVVLAGEDRNDRRSMRVVLEHVCPEMRGRIVEINDAARLRSATPESLATRVSTLARKVRARAALEQADVACVFVHEDFDEPDCDARAAVVRRVQAELSRALGTAHYVLAAWEIEAWLLLFPDALTAFARGWGVPKQLRGRDTGLLEDPKRILINDVSAVHRRYRESDAPDVLAKVVDLGLVDRPAAVNRSWTDFRGSATRCCAEHLRR